MNKIWNFMQLTESMIQYQITHRSHKKQHCLRIIRKKIQYRFFCLIGYNYCPIQSFHQLQKMKNEKKTKPGKSKYQSLKLVFQQLLKIRKNRQRDIQIIESIESLKITIKQLRCDIKKVEIRSVLRLNEIVFHLVLASRNNSQPHNRYYQNSMYQLTQVTKRLLSDQKIGEDLSKEIIKQSRKKIFFINLLKEYDQPKNKQDFKKMNSQYCQFYNKNINFCQIWVSKIDEKLKSLSNRKQLNQELIKLLKEFENQLSQEKIEKRKKREQMEQIEKNEQRRQREQMEQMEQMELQGQKEQKEQREDKIEGNQNKLKQLNKEISCNQNPEDYNKTMESLIDSQQNQIFKTQPQQIQFEEKKPLDLFERLLQEYEYDPFCQGSDIEKPKHIHLRHSHTIQFV